MIDRINNEMISAYVDGELDAVERALVEKALAESAECRRFYAELKGLRSGLRSLPRHRLPEGFHDRVMQRIQAIAPAQRVAARTHESHDRTWRRWPRLSSTAVMAASVAVLVFLVVFSEFRSSFGPANKRQAGIGGEIAEAPGKEEPGRVPDGGLAPARNAGPYATVNTPTRAPHYVFVVDLTITRKGQTKRVFETVLAASGIRFDPSIKVDEELEKALLASRFIGDVERVVPGAANQAVNADDIEMVYVAGSDVQLDAAANAFRSCPRDEIVDWKLDMSIDPSSRQAFGRLNAASRMARNEAIESPRAYRLVFRFSLRSTSAGFMGMMATPSITAKLVPVDKTGSLPATEKARASLPVPSDLVSGGASRRTWRAEGPAAASQTGQDVVPDDHFAEAIFVLRNLRSDAVAPK